MRILDPHAAGLDAADAPRGRAHEEDIPGEALDREVFIERADHHAFRLRYHLIACVLGIAPPEVIAASRAPRRPRTLCEPGLGAGTRRGVPNARRSPR